MESQFKENIRALLDIVVIRKSSIQHRTTTIMVNFGTTVDPKTGQEINGKPRMVFEY